MKKKEGLDYKDYWKNRIGYDYETEIAIYAYVCRSSKSLSKKQRNVEKSYQYNSYKDWESHVLSIVSNSVVEINEFKRFLLNGKRKSNSFDNIANSTLIPILVFLIGEFIVDFGKYFSDIWIYQIEIENISKLEMVLVYLIAVFLAVILPAGILIGAIVIFIKMIISISGKNKFEKLFYNDYIEIVDRVILLLDQQNSIMGTNK